MDDGARPASRAPDHISTIGQTSSIYLPRSTAASSRPWRKTMARRPRSGIGSKVDMPITPMLDMTFQLLAFFVLTFQPQSALEGKLEFSLPANPPPVGTVETPPVIVEPREPEDSCREADTGRQDSARRPWQRQHQGPDPGERGRGNRFAGP